MQGLPSCISLGLGGAGWGQGQEAWTHGRKGSVLESDLETRGRNYSISVHACVVTRAARRAGKPVSNHARRSTPSITVC